MTLPLEWRRRLKASGFVDIECATRRDDLPVFLNPGVGRNSRRADSYDDTAEYYRRAGLFLHSHRFASALDRQIWALHAEGASCEKIGITTSTYRDLADLTIHRLRAIMLRRGNAGNAGKPPTDAKALIRRLETMDDALLLSVVPLLVAR